MLATLRLHWQAMHYPEFFQHPESGTCLRLHVVGGFTSPNDWIHLGYCAAHWADGSVYIRPNSAIELRGVTDKAQLAAELDKLELQSFHIPVLASPLSAAAKQAARELATHLYTEQPGLESLAITTTDDDLPASATQVSMRLLDDATLDIIQSPATNSPTAGLSLADAAAHLQRLGAQSTETKGTGASGSELNAEPGPIGWLDEHQADGVVDLGAGVHQGAIPAQFAQLIGQLEVAITVTPWGGLVFHDIAEGDAEVVLRVLAPRGFIFDINSPLLRDGEAD
ncbi:cobalamin biosynthesis protein [Corynebacterium segmentosum]|uniref:Cobalamin biosynthesis protein n=2 Tax=Corynebacteriaceae TaxID=1653 RepID=A0ABY6TFY8_9CORY|nr:cobalamin biosynthesis protein [Corynebacterium segmentosum]